MRRPVTVVIVCTGMLFGLEQGSAHADVTVVAGSAHGYYTQVGLGGQPPSTVGPTPAVALAPSAANSPQTAFAASGRADAGPATLFSSGRIDVGTQGALGPTGSVASSAGVQNVNASGNEVLEADSLASGCTASEGAVSGSTTVTGGTLQTDSGDDDLTNTIPDHPPVIVALPASPAPNTTITGHVHIGNTTDSFRHVLNEQVVNADGSITVNASHQYLLGPFAVGEVIIGRLVCGVTAPLDTAPPQTTVDAGPTGTVATNSATFGFSSSEAGSTFQCRLDGPGAMTGTYATCTSPRGYMGLADGAYTFSVRATDAAGNTDASPAARAFAVGSPPPPGGSPPPPAGMGGSPPPLTALIDNTPPVAKLGGSRSQKLGKAVVVRVSCLDQPCRATAEGTVSIPAAAARARPYRLGKVTVAIPKGGGATLAPKLSLATRSAIRRALRRGHRIVARLRITVVDAAGNKRVLARQVRLRL